MVNSLNAKTPYAHRLMPSRNERPPLTDEECEERAILMADLALETAEHHFRTAMRHLEQVCDSDAHIPAHAYHAGQRALNAAGIGLNIVSRREYDGA